MKYASLLFGLLLFAFLTGSSTAEAAPKLTDAQRSVIRRLLDANGDGVISVSERGAARLFVGANRQQRAVGRNERVVRRIR